MCSQHPARRQAIVEWACRMVKIEEIDIRLCREKGSKQDPEDPEAWEREIEKAGLWKGYVFSDGTLVEGGKVGGGAFILWQEGE